MALDLPDIQVLSLCEHNKNVKERRMSSDTFRAAVQYGDWRGTASADNADQNDLRDFLVAKGLFDRDKEFLIGASLWIGENHGGEVQAPFISAITTELDNQFDNLEQKLASLNGAIPTRRVDLELTLEEFIGLFKRFAVVLTTRGLNLEDREYEWAEQTT